MSYKRRAEAASGSTKPQKSAVIRTSESDQAHTETGGIWKKGQIHRIRLHNFLTFDEVELFPTPQLNVIVGPNGTGKSSIVCAICIGLGGRATLLGRAKELKDYVKHNKVEGWVELELYNDRSRNWVIRRLLSSDANSSSWMLNGKEVLKKEIDKLTTDLQIQLDNKCQFLPQDMVVEFARMDAASLLEETEKAIGPKDLHANHMKLKELQKDRQTSHSGIQEKIRQRETEMSRNQLLQRDVERFRNRQQFLIKIKHLKMKKCWLEYQNGRNQYLEAKENRKNAVKEYKLALNEYQPIAKKHEQQDKAVASFVKDGQTARDAWRKSMRSFQMCKERLEGLEEEVDGPRQELEEKKKEEERRRKKIAQLQKEIQAYTVELEKLEDPASITPLIAEKQGRIRELSSEVTQLNHELQELRSQREEYIQHLRGFEDELHQMQNVRNQRLHLLQRVDRDTYDAVLWLDQNRHLFKEHVFEPILLSVNVRDANYTSQVEAVLAGKDFYSFVAQTKEDKSTLLRELNDRKRLKINVVMAPSHALSEYQSEIQPNTLHQYGFAGMIMEFIEAPAPQLAFYCQYHGLHNIPIADHLSPQQLDRVMKDLKSLRRFFTRDTQYSLTRSRYRDNVIMKSGKTWPPRFLTASIDVQRKTELETQIKSAQHSISVFDEQYNDLQKREEELRREDSKLRHEKNQLKMKIDSYKQAQSNISSRETRLRGVENTTFDLAAEEEKVRQEIEKIQKKRVDTVVTLSSKLEEAKIKLVDCSKAWLLVRNSKLKVTHLLYQHRMAKSKMDSAEQAKQSSGRDEADKKAKVLDLLNTARTVSGVNRPQDDQELMSVFNTFPEDLDGVEEVIHECRAQADLCMGINEEAVREYEKTEKKIKALDREISEMQASSENATGELNTLKERWLAPLRDLLGKVSVRFSEYFNLMKCVGEVALHEDPKDFGRYAVKISVKFRDSEELQPLNAQRQSGGERSVSTMLYLMALQGITQCPFRIVDEINQGMDPVNERRVFDLIVAATSQGSDSSQYFIITPKLLRDLNYTDAVTVHVVYNGQEMPNFKEWTAESFLH